MNKKEITVTKPFMPALSEYIEYVEKIWNNCWVTNKGPLFKEFHLLLQNYLSVDNLSLTVNDLPVRTVHSDFLFLTLRRE